MQLDELLPRMHEWMRNYMRSFYTDDAEVQQGILIKETHTYYVTSIALRLARELKLDEHGKNLAETIGLFHDAGRFRQYQVYRTFNDAQSEDHAELSLKVLDEEMPFFHQIDEADQNLIRISIQNHNKKTIEQLQNPREILFAKLIRDADKLDIYRVLSPFLDQKNADKMPNFIKGKQRPEISSDFVQNFCDGEQADFRLIRTNGDRKIVRLMWLYDINFPWTMKMIKRRGYIDKIVSALPMEQDAEKLQTGLKRLMKHVEAVIKKPVDFENLV